MENAMWILVLALLAAPHLIYSLMLAIKEWEENDN